MMEILSMGMDAAKIAILNLVSFVKNHQASLAAKLFLLLLK
jgi:hypothetical protein